MQYNVHFLTSTREHLVLSERYDSSDDYATREGAFEIEWTAEKQVCLPGTLDTVTQQVKTPNINIYHVLAFTIELRGASGGLSTVCPSFYQRSIPQMIHWGIADMLRIV